MAAPTLQFKRGLLVNLPALRAGEPGFTTNTSDFYIGLDNTLGNNKFFGSARYWNKETATVGSSVRVVEGTNNGSNFVALKSPDLLTQDYTYTLPTSYGTPGYVLQSDGSGGLTWAAAGAASAISGITIQDEGSTVGTAASVSSINFVGDGIVATASGAGATVTVSTASTTVIGVASFNSTDFYVTSGAVGINTESIQDMAGSAITAGINTNITVTYDDANNRFNHNVNTATTSTLGVASFNSANFTVSDGAVSIANNAVGLGTNTFGQYAKSITSGNGLSGTAANADDGTDYTIDVNVGAGITITSDAVAFKNAASLSNNTLMKYDTSNAQLSNSVITDDGTTATVTGNLTVTGTLTGTASTAAAVAVNDTDAQTGGLVFASAGTNATLYNDTDLTYDSNTNRLTAVNVTASTEVRTPSVKAGDGTAAITINDTTGNVGISSNLTVNGNLYVAGSTTQINTTTLQVEDRVIELGKVQGTAPTDTTWDLGILFNYYTASSNKKASVYWENGEQRFLFASDVTESVTGLNLPDSGAVGLGTTTPQLTSPVFAPIEVGALWANDASSYGSSAVVAFVPLGGLYTDSPADRYLQNIVVDAGTF